jgi:hypothetical protein
MGRTVDSRADNDFIWGIEAKKDREFLVWSPYELSRMPKCELNQWVEAILWTRPLNIFWLISYLSLGFADRLVSSLQRPRSNKELSAPGLRFWMKWVSARS